MHIAVLVIAMTICYLTILLIITFFSSSHYLSIQRNTAELQQLMMFHFADGSLGDGLSNPSRTTLIIAQN